jgi:hypothetical protein
MDVLVLVQIVQEEDGAVILQYVIVVEIVEEERMIAVHLVMIAR